MPQLTDILLTFSVFHLLVFNPRAIIIDSDTLITALFNLQIAAKGMLNNPRKAKQKPIRIQPILLGESQ